MSNDVMHSALTAWATRDLPARLLAAQVEKLLNCTVEDVALLASAGKLRALGKPRPNAVKYFSTVELIALLADPDWLDKATKTIGQFGRRKNARRQGLRDEPLTAGFTNSEAKHRRVRVRKTNSCLRQAITRAASAAFLLNQYPLIEQNLDVAQGGVCGTLGQPGIF